MDLNRHNDPLLIGFLILSLLLHLMFLYLVPRHSLFPAPSAQQPPVVVEMREPEPKPRELELPKTPDQVRTKPAKRLGPSDQQVEKETAPRGQDLEDRTAHAPSPASKPRQQATVKPRPAQPTPPAIASEKQPLRTETAPAPPQTAPQLPANLPSLKDLQTLPQSTSDRMFSQQMVKERDDVAEGDTVWLDTEKDLLFSFFQRFKSGIYRVWNYPPEAIDHGQQGDCLLKITINHDGSVADVELKGTSGSEVLDREAIAAVRRGGPYGELPRAYKKEKLFIYASFRYTLLGSGRAIFGRN